MPDALPPRWRKVLRDLALHPGRSLLVTAAIAAGIVGAGSVLTAASVLRTTVTRGYLATNPASATLHTEAVDDSLSKLVGRVPGVTAVEVRRRVVGRAQVGNEWLPLHLFVLEDYGKNRIGRVEPREGRWPPPGGTVVLERSSLALLEDAGMATPGGTAPAPSMSVAVGAGPTRTVALVGVARDAGLAPGWMEHVVYGFATPETLRRLGVPPGFDEIRIVVDGGTTDEVRVRRTAFEAARVVEATGRAVRDVSIPPPGRHVHAGQMDSLLWIQGVFGVFTLLLSGVLVVNLLNAVLGEQIREIGVMKAVGAGTGQVAGIYLGMALLLGVAASLVGIPLARSIGREYAVFAASLLNFDASGQAAHPAVLGAQLLLGLLLPVAASAVPVYAGSRVTPREALSDYGLGRDAGRKGGRRSDAKSAPPARPGWWPRRGRLTGPVLLAVRNAFRRRARLALTVVALATGGAAFLGALNLRAGIRHTVATAFAGNRFDLSLSLSTAAPDAAVRAAAESVPGVTRVETWRRTSASVAYDDGTRGNAFPLTGLPPATERVDYPVLEGRWLEPGDRNALVVNDLFVRTEPHVAVGDTVVLSVAGIPSTWRVVGVVRSTFISPAAYASRSRLGRVLGEPGRVDRAVVVAGVEGPGERARLLERLERTLADRELPASGEWVDEARVVLEDHMLMAAGFLVAMAALIIAVGGLGLATTMNLAVVERTREIGVLRAIGADHGTVRRLVVVEGLVVGVVSCLLAVPLSLPVTHFVGSGFGRIMLNAPVDVVFAPSAFVVWTVVVLLVSLGASLAPAVRATRSSAAEALAYR